MPEMKPQSTFWTSSPLQYTISWIILAVLLVYTFAFLVLFPFIGFYYSNVTGSIDYVFVPSPEESGLQVGDMIQRVGSVDWQTYQANLRQPLYAGAEPGELLDMVVERAGEQVTVRWPVPGWNLNEMVSRSSNIHWLAFFFWLAGLLVVVLIRPRDSRQGMLAGFFNLTALWLMFGSTGTMRIWDATVLFRMTIWICVPFYLHFHWIFPRPIRTLPGLFWLPFYFLGAMMALAEWLQLLPTNAYLLGMLAFLLGSLLLLLAHFIRQRDQRRQLGILVFTVFLSLLPVIIITGAQLVVEVTAASALSLFALAGLPLAYFYTAYRRQPGWPQTRANRVVAFYFFFILLFLLGIVLASWIARGGSGQLGVVSATVLVLALAALAILGYPRFRRFVERRLLGVRIDPQEIVAAYASRIPTSLNHKDLGRLLEEELMPSMLVRQSALLQMEDGLRPQTIYADNVEPQELPDQGTLTEMIGAADRPLLAEEGHNHSWMQLALPLVLQGELLGAWLFGRRDPDDVYSAADVNTLQILGHQTAVALANINQAERLLRLYDDNIQRHEEERKNLARVLHDEVLSEIAAMGLQAQEEEHGDRIGLGRSKISEQIRELIAGLRPPMIEYGLWRAFVEFVDDLEDRDGAPAIELAIEKSDNRYPENVEEHLFRIMQQAAENALQHAQAKQIKLGGRLAPDEVSIFVQDDGRSLGFDPDPDMSRLLREGHYGLVGMVERAHLIGGELKISSEPGSYTTIAVTWRAPA